MIDLLCFAFLQSSTPFGIVSAEKDQSNICVLSDQTSFLTVFKKDEFKGRQREIMDAAVKGT